jgi:thioredoxin reductase (NADPH)
VTEIEPDVLILGGGAAGATCALYLGRAGLDVVIVDQNRTTLKRAELHNFPGLDPLAGIGWLAVVQRQARSTGHVDLIDGRVVSVEPSSNTFIASGDFGRSRSRYLVVASGQGTTPFAERLQLDEVPPIQPYVKTNFLVDRWGETTIAGLFAVGVVAGHPSQAVICAGSGASAAIRIVSLERGEFWVDHDSPSEG